MADQDNTQIDPRPVAIYGLFDPRTGDCRYIGQTCRPLGVRLKQHKWYALHGEGEKTPCQRWLMKIYGLGLKPKMEVLDTVPPGGDWVARERMWIKFFREKGPSFGHTSTNLNISEGGEGCSGGKRSAQTKALMSAWQKGSPKTEAQLKVVRDLADKRRGKPSGLVHSAESRKLMTGRPSLLGRPMTKEEKLAKARDANRRCRLKKHAEGKARTTSEARKAWNAAHPEESAAKFARLQAASKAKRDAVKADREAALRKEIGVSLECRDLQPLPSSRPPNTSHSLPPNSPTSIRQLSLPL